MRAYSIDGRIHNNKTTHTHYTYTHTTYALHTHYTHTHIYIHKLDTHYTHYTHYAYSLTYRYCTAIVICMYAHPEKFLRKFLKKTWICGHVRKEHITLMSRCQYQISLSHINHAVSQAHIDAWSTTLLQASYVCAVKALFIWCGSHHSHSQYIYLQNLIEQLIT